MFRCNKCGYEHKNHPYKKVVVSKTGKLMENRTMGRK